MINHVTQTPDLPMRSAYVLLPFVVLVACTTPREDCINDVTRDLRVLNSLVAETQANLQRGYAIDQQQEVRTVRRTCKGRNSDGTTFRYRCDKTDTFTTNRPVAIDLNAERSKLESLLQRRQQTEAISNQGVAQCIAVHPE